MIYMLLTTKQKKKEKEKGLLKLEFWDRFPFFSLKLLVIKYIRHIWYHVIYAYLHETYYVN